MLEPFINQDVCLHGAGLVRGPQGPSEVPWGTWGYPWGSQVPLRVAVRPRVVPLGVSGGPVWASAVPLGRGSATCATTCNFKHCPTWLANITKHKFTMLTDKHDW